MVKSDYTLNALEAYKFCLEPKSTYDLTKITIYLKFRNKSSWKSWVLMCMKRLSDIGQISVAVAFCHFFNEDQKTINTLVG